MQRIKQIIDEIRELKNEASHKSALRINTLMENNKKLFLQIMDEADFIYLSAGFENISHQSPLNFSTAGHVEEYRKLSENLLFHCNRVL